MPKTPRGGSVDQLGNFFGNGQGRPKWKDPKIGGWTLGIFLWGEGTIMSHKIWEETWNGGTELIWNK